MARRVIDTSFIRLVASAAAAVVFAAAGSSAQSAQDSAAAQAPRHSSKYVLTSDDLTRVKANNLYDAIRKLRPEYLRNQRGPTSFTKLSSNGARGERSSDPSPSGVGETDGTLPIIVYVDGARIDGVENLKQFTADQVKEVRFVPGPEAGVRFGTDHAGGVLLLTTH